MEPDIAFTFEADLWLYPGNAAWHFVTLPEENGSAARFFTGRKAGFGSIPVIATIGETRWKTSIFPDSKSGSYLLPIKAAVRKCEALAAGDRLTVHLTINP